jgi:hypothetical protein
MSAKARAVRTVHISATEFKSTCLDVFRELERRHVTRVVVTRRGKPIAVLSPPDDGPVDPWGALRGQVVVPVQVDLTRPVLPEEFDAARGELHR